MAVRLDAPVFDSGRSSVNAAAMPAAAAAHAAAAAPYELHSLKRSLARVNLPSDWAFTTSSHSCADFTRVSAALRSFPFVPVAWYVARFVITTPICAHSTINPAAFHASAPAAFHTSASFWAAAAAAFHASTAALIAAAASSPSPFMDATLCLSPASRASRSCSCAAAAACLLVRPLSDILLLPCRMCCVRAHTTYVVRPPQPLRSTLTPRPPPPLPVLSAVAAIHSICCACRRAAICVYDKCSACRRPLSCACTCGRTRSHAGPIGGGGPCRARQGRGAPAVPHLHAECLTFVRQMGPRPSGRGRRLYEYYHAWPAVLQWGRALADAEGPSCQRRWC